MIEVGTAPHARRHRYLLVAGMLLVAVNLRAALGSVGPLVEPVMEATGLSAAAFGLLTTLPLIAFGAVSMLAPGVTRRLGLGGALVLALSLILTGAGARPFGGVALLFAGTALLGVGIALGNVLMPALVKQHFAERSGPLTSLYSSAMGLGATIGAGVSVPLSRTIGWRAALAVWAIPAAIALLFWLPRARGAKRARREAATPAGALPSVARSPLAWQIALFMGFQSLTFYVVLAWLPDLLQSRGMDASAAGWLLALSQATGIAGSAIIPAFAARRSDQTAVVWLLGALESVSLLGLLLSGGGWPAGVWVGILGFVMGGTFSLALLFLVLRARDTPTSARLSGMAQSVGYLIAAAGPALIGWVRDATGTWTIPLLCLFGVLAAKMTSGFGAARQRVVGMD
jgi:CP family cyanate transporter-like MFS transporter